MTNRQHRTARRRGNARWQLFELLVAKIQAALHGNVFEVELDHVLDDGHGTRSQIDVFLRPKSDLLRPVLISCKAEKGKVVSGERSAS